MEAWLDALEEGATVVTATNRLARALRRAYGERRRAAGSPAWPSPDAVSWSAWLHRQWQDLRDFQAVPGVLLEPVQERALWEQVMAADPESPPGLRVAGTAPAVREAWELVHQWRLDAAETALDSAEAADSVDAAAFRRWRRAFETELERGGWLTRAQLPDRLAAALTEGRLPAPSPVLLAGFEDVSPQQAALLEAVRQAGGAADQAPDPGAAQGDIRLAAFPDRDAEIRAAAAWARRELEVGSPGPVAIVAPELSEVREPLERALLEAFHDPLAHPDRSPLDLAFNLSLGEPLAATPPVHAALQALTLCVDRLPLAEAGALVRSPFLGGAEAEAKARAALDLRLRTFGGEGVSRSVVARLAADDTAGCPVLAEGLAGARRRLETAERNLVPSAWAEVLAGVLADLGWPGERAPDSVEHQVQSAWRTDVLEGMAALDAVLGPVGVREALGRLRRLAEDAVFQPRTASDAPVQVLGILEAEGLRFDRLWLLGLHESAWPQPPRPSPFLPRRLQRAQDLPRATPERELRFAERITGRLLAAAPAGVASYPRRGPRDEAFQPSPLVAHLPRPEETLDQPLASREWEAAQQDPAALETLDDPAGPPLAGDRAAPGGAGLFREQSACPFRAFARYRLGATAPEAPLDQPDARLRGILMHRALEAVWQGLGDQATLNGLDAETVRARCREAAAGAVRAVRHRHPGLFGDRAAELEADRLTDRLAAWLAKEAGRHTPFRVLEREAGQEAELNGVRFRLTPDRVDELADGRRLVLDYKTGEADYRLWLGERPEEPQLPLYVLALGEAVAGAAYVRLKPDLMDFNGLAAAGIDEGASGRGLKPAEQAKELEGAGWEELVAHWRQVLEALAGEIAGGRAEVAPRFPPGSNKSPCRTCDLPALCRIHDSTPGTGWEAAHG